MAGFGPVLLVSRESGMCHQYRQKLYCRQLSGGSRWPIRRARILPQQHARTVAPHVKAAQHVFLLRLLFSSFFRLNIALKPDRSVETVAIHHGIHMNMNLLNTVFRTSYGIIPALFHLHHVQSCLSFFSFFLFTVAIRQTLI